MISAWRIKARWHCPHERKRGIFGDEINYAPGFRRLACLDCGRFLDGPVSLATHVSVNGGLFSAEWYLGRNAEDNN